MLLEEYVSKAEEVAELTESGNHEGPLQILKGLLEADLPDLDKSVMWVNAATVYDKMDRFEEAIRCYDEAIALEEPHNRRFSMERKADFLANKGGGKESLAIYRSLLERSDLTLVDRGKILKNVRRVKQHFGF